MKRGKVVFCQKEPLEHQYVKQKTMEELGREKVKGWFERVATWLLLKHVKGKRPYNTMEFNSHSYKVRVLNHAMYMFVVAQQQIEFHTANQENKHPAHASNLVLQETHFALSISKKSNSGQHATFKSTAHTGISKQIV